MNLQIIHQHTFDIDALKPGAIILDVGCFDFFLTNCLLDLGCHVVGMEPNRSVQNIPTHRNFTFINKALVSRINARKGIATFHVPTDPYGAYVRTGDNPVSTISNQSYLVPIIDIVFLSDKLGIDHWTAIKLDCEGSEYEILLDWPGPIASQISVEFHDHLHDKDLSTVYGKILDHLGQWYNVHQWKRTGRKPSTRNYWDVLFTLNVNAQKPNNAVFSPHSLRSPVEA